jgi:hypothetical protein
LNNTDANKLVHEIADLEIAPGDVIVELLARLARYATQDHHKRFVARSSDLDTLSQIVVDPIVGSRVFITICAYFRIAILGHRPLCTCCEHPERKKQCTRWQDYVLRTGD